MLDSIDMMFQMYIDMYSGYIRRVPDDVDAVSTLMALRQERKDYHNDNTLNGKVTFMELTNQIDDIIHTKIYGRKRDDLS